MRKWTLFLLLAIILLIPIAANAQDSPIIESLEVDLWPEYDRPEMLVIYHIMLSSSTSFPRAISIRIPAVADQPHAVAVRSEDGNLVYEDYEYRTDGEWAFIDINVEVPEIRIEYYDPGLSIEGTKRQFEFIWTGDFAVESFVVLVQQPYESRQLTTTPSAESTFQGPEGLIRHAIELGSIQEGDSQSISVQYTKESNTLSIDGQPVQPSVQINASTPGRVTVLDVLPWALGVLGIILLVGGVLWYWQTGREQPKARSLRRRSRPTTKTNRTSLGDEDAIYCHQCGKRAGSGDRFCRSCGSKLRSP